MKYLVTGGAGFIGSHLAEALLNKGGQVTIMDDLSTGAIENIQHLKGRYGFRYVRDTVLNQSVVMETVEEADMVLHLAAAVGVKRIVESPVRTIKTNVKGTEVVLECAVEWKKSVVLFSTSEVYGKAGGTKFSETSDLLLGPTFKGRWSYAASKIIDEFLALAYYKERKLPVIIIRLFNTAGPRQTGRYGMVIPRFVQQALAGEPITVYGDGKQTRTFAHVKDVVWAILKLIEHPNAIGEIFNVGGKEEVSIERLAHLVKEVLQSSSLITHIPYEEAYEEGFDDIRERVPDLNKVQSFVGYNPKFSLEDIIVDVAEYQKSKGFSLAR